MGEILALNEPVRGIWDSQSIAIYTYYQYFRSQICTNSSFSAIRAAYPAYFSLLDVMA
jgi:hypothetical protein